MLNHAKTLARALYRHGQGVLEAAQDRRLGIATTASGAEAAYDRAARNAPDEMP